MSAPIVLDAEDVHHTDISLALAREMMPVVERNAGKTFLHRGPGAEALLVDVIAYLADRRDAFAQYCAARDRDQHAAPVELPYEPTSWLELDDAPERLATASLGQLVAECDQIAPERREAALAPIVEWAEATGNLEYPKLEILRNAIAQTKPAVEVDVAGLEGKKAGDEWDWMGDEPEELAGRHVRCVGFSKEPGKMRVVQVGPWQADPNVREPIGGEGATSTFMAGTRGPGDVAETPPSDSATVQRAKRQRAAAKADA